MSIVKHPFSLFGSMATSGDLTNMGANRSLSSHVVTFTGICAHKSVVHRV